MKWYFCLNEPGLLGFSEIILAAVHSALKHTTLRPHLVFDGSKNALTDYLTSLGVEVIYHRSSFAELIDGARPQPGYAPEVARGAYLRLDIASLETEDEYVLYTDCDVLFLHNPDILFIKPKIIAAAQEYAQITTNPTPYYKIFNSGSMVINVKEFKRNFDDLVEFSRRNDFYFHGDGGFYDQGALNKFFSGKWEVFDRSLNWRPFSGVLESPQILHFHGIKPYELAYILHGDISKCRPVAKKLFDLQPIAYLNACEAYLRFLPSEAEGLRSLVAPGAPGFLSLGRERVIRLIAEMRQKLMAALSGPQCH